MQVKLGELGTTFTGELNNLHNLEHRINRVERSLAANKDSAVDIFCVGLCLLEMTTLEAPYSECNDLKAKEKKYTYEVLPESLEKLADKKLLQGFIRKCLARPNERPCVADLLKDPFF